MDARYAASASLTLPPGFIALDSQLVVRESDILALCGVNEHLTFVHMRGNESRISVLASIEECLQRIERQH